MACNKCGRPLSESHRPQPVALGCEPKQSRPNRVTPEPSVIRGCGKVVRPLCEFGTGAVEPRNPQHGPQSPIRPGFAGVYTPAFVVRAGPMTPTTDAASFRRGLHPGLRCAHTTQQPRYHQSPVSPGFTPRPSLCAVDPVGQHPPGPRFAGVYTPAFVVRGAWSRG